MSSEFFCVQTPKIIYGAGRFSELGKIACCFGRTALIVTGAHSLKKSGRLNSLFKALAREDVACRHFCVNGEPSPELIDEAVSSFRENNIDVVIAVGGGSVIDAGKAISAMLSKDDSIENYLEGMGDIKHDGEKIPFIAVPTTAGTGSEATKNAVISRVGKDGFKKSLRHDNFVPDVALVDPELYLTCPPEVTAACSLDSFTQLLESYVSVKANPVTDALALKGLELIGSNLLPSCTNCSDDVKVRGSMALAALFSGITLTGAGLGIVHGLASSLGSNFPIPHGVVCATLIGAATRENIRLLRQAGETGKRGLSRFAEAGRVVTGSKGGKIDSDCDLLVNKIDEWVETLKIPRLGVYSTDLSDLDSIVGKTSLKNNPINITEENMKSILRRRL